MVLGIHPSLIDSTSVQYITMFDTTWAYGNEYVKGLFSELSNEYSSESIVFLHVDLTRSQALADQLQVNIGGYSGEIPTFICFRKVQYVPITDYLGKRDQ